MSNKTDNVGLAAEFAVAGMLTNAGWFAAMMASATFPGIDIMARKHGYDPVSVQVKATRAKRSFFIIDGQASLASGRTAEVAAQLYVFASNTTPGFNTTWTTWIMTRAEVRAALRQNAGGGAFVPLSVVCTQENRDAWHKLDQIAVPIPLVVENSKS